MNIKHWTPALVGLFMAIGSVQAFADNNWSYDEDSQTIVFEYSGSPVSQSSSHSDDEGVDHAGTWYYDDSSETIVHTSEGSRARYVRSNPSDEAVFNFELAYLDL